MHWIEQKKAPGVAVLSGRALKVGEALGEFVALFDLVIHTACENLDSCFYRFEPRTDALEAVVDGVVQIAKLPFGRSGQHVNLFGDGLKMLFDAVEALLKVSFPHEGKYSMADIEEAASSLDHLVSENE